MTIHWKAVEQCFTVVLFVFQFYPFCNFGTFIHFGLGIVRSEEVYNLDNQRGQYSQLTIKNANRHSIQVGSECHSSSA